MGGAGAGEGGAGEGVGGWGGKAGAARLRSCARAEGARAASPAGAPHLWIRPTARRLRGSTGMASGTFLSTGMVSIGCCGSSPPCGWTARGGGGRASEGPYASRLGAEFHAASRGTAAARVPPTRVDIASGLGLLLRLGHGH